MFLNLFAGVERQQFAGHAVILLENLHPLRRHRVDGIRHPICLLNNIRGTAPMKSVRYSVPVKCNHDDFRPLDQFNPLKNTSRTDEQGLIVSNFEIL